MVDGYGPSFRPPPPPPPPVTQWTKGDVPPLSTPAGPTLTSGQTANTQPPAVPSQDGGSGTTVVDTPSLDTFAENMGKLMAPVKDAWSTLNGLSPIAAGSFADATNIRTKVSGDSSGASGSSSDLLSSYLSVLDDLHSGLSDLQVAAQQMSQKYTTADDLNGMSATDLQNDLEDTQNLFGNMMSANGGAPAASTTTTPPPPT